MATFMVFDPTGACREDSSVSQPLTGLAGKVVGFIDNTKPNFRELAKAIGARLVSGLGVSRVGEHRKQNQSVAASDEAIDSLANDCDLVISGSGD